MANTSHSGGQGKQASSPGVKKPPIVSTSWSFTDNEPDTKYDHAWSIANFAKKMEMENGEELKSGVFSIRTKDRTTDWFMRINPNGEEKTCKGFVSLFLYKVYRHHTFLLNILFLTRECSNCYIQGNV